LGLTLLLFVFFSFSGIPETRSEDAAYASASPALEVQVQAACIFNFIQYVEWPEQINDAAQKEFIIAVLGRNGMSATLQELVAGQTVDGRKVVIRPVNEMGQIGLCHILFIENAHVRTFLESGDLVREGRLTVAAAANFTRGGGMINFVKEEGRVRFEINPDAARKAKLTISSRLLQLGVATGPER
jgi:hypothetical protein